MADRYRPLFKLDSGGMAEVYVAEAESMAGFKKKVAIKRILPGLLKDDRFVRMFLDEARLSLHLSHANIVSVFDIGKSSSTYFIVMEYVDGTNLKYVLQYLSRRRVTMPVHMTVWLVNEILKGLDYAHNLRDPETGRSFGVVHRDISPPNVLVSWNGEVKLTDFGLAKASTQLESTDPGVVKGKFSYLSPEAANGQEVDHRADLFAVGIIAYEMLTGRRLFLGESDYQTVEMVRKAEVPSMQAINPEVPVELEKIIRKALARDVALRYQSASDMADDLLGFLFSRSLKVSSRDLSELLEDLRRDDPAATPKEEPGEESNLIIKLINEEFLNFKSLDEDSDAPVTGSMPLDSLLGESQPYDPATPLPIGDFDRRDDDSSPPPIGRNEATPPPSPGSAPMNFQHPSMTSPTSRSPAGQPHTAGAGGSAAPWIILLLVLLAAGGGAFYFFVLRGGAL